MLRDEIQDYIDSFGLVGPGPTKKVPGRRGSDNGPSFTSEYFMMLRFRKEEQPRDGNQYRTLLMSCIDPPGILRRAPGLPKQNGPDDHYAVMAGLKIFGFHDIAEGFLKHGLKHFGFFNTPNPDGYFYPAIYEDPKKAGKFNWSAFLIRQPALIACMLSAARKNKWHHGPIYAAAAIGILLSGWRRPLYDVDARRLGWQIIQTIAEDSVLCWVASKIWYKRLYRDYGLDGMRGVAKRYYSTDHPFRRYWVDEKPGGYKFPWISLGITIPVFSLLAAGATLFF